MRTVLVRVVGWLIALGVLAPVPAIAGPDYEEPPGDDAGNQLDEAHDTKGTGQLQFIRGELEGNTLSRGGGQLPDFEDLYVIRVVLPTMFFISTDGGGNQFDSQLFLFRSDGTAMLANLDASPGAAGGATILRDATDGSGASVTPGIYYLGISGALDLPYSGPVPPIGEMFEFATPDEISGPDGAGASMPLASWGPPGETGTYVIALGGCTFLRGCDGDADGDGDVDTDDISHVIFRLGSSVEPGADVDDDGVVSVGDIGFVIFRLGTCM